MGASKQRAADDVEAGYLAVDATGFAADDVAGDGADVGFEFGEGEAF